MSTEPSTTYALVSHESAVEAIWALAARGWKGVLDDDNVWLVPSPENCVKTQGEVKKLAAEVDLAALGINRTPIDLLVPDKSCYSRGKRAKFHVWGDFFAPRSFVRVHERVLVSTPYFAVLQLAMWCRVDRLSHEEACRSAEEDARLRAELGVEGEGSTAEELVRWENIARLVRAVQVLSDFMGTYRYALAVADGAEKQPDITYGTQPIVTPEHMAAYLAQMGSVRGIERARRVSDLAYAGAASPMETFLALMLSLPCDMGGFGLPRPQMNYEVHVDAQRRELSSQETMFVDLGWPDPKVAVEFYGWDEHFGAGPVKVASDASRANSLTALGWTVFHVTYEQVKTVASVTLLARQVAAALGVSLPEPSDLELVWRSRLLALLLPKTGRQL